MGQDLLVIFDTLRALCNKLLTILFFQILFVIFTFVIVVFSLQSTSSIADTVKGNTSTKKARVKRRLEFSASDYKSKKKIRVKSDVVISISPLEPSAVKKHSKSLPSDQKIPDEEVGLNL